MTQDQMIAAILQSIQTDANLLLIMRLMIANNINNAPLANIQGMCTALGINTAGI